MNAPLASFRNLYYQCRFHELRRQLDELPASALTPEHLLIKANTLFELNEPGEAKATLELVSRQERDSAAQLHALARMSYMAKGYQQAREIWYQLYEKTTNSHYRFVALLGIANSLFDQGDDTLLPTLIEELESFDEAESADDQICLHHLLGNYALSFHRDFASARDHYEKALGLAARHNWNYFTIRSFFGMALIARQEEKSNELKWTLKILENIVDGSEAQYLNYMIQDEFKLEYSSSSPVEFDREHMRLMIKDRWIVLNERPKLYEFLELLHIRGSYVDKHQIAVRLWPNESYKPRVHDPRIFDIAKRVRMLLDDQQDAELALLSGRRGYKLAVN